MARPRTVRGRQRMYERNINRVRQRNSEYASVLSDPKSRFQSTSSATTDKDNIKTYLERPYDMRKLSPLPCVKHILRMALSARFLIIINQFPPITIRFIQY